MTSPLRAATFLVMLGATPALAGHANPWATPEDDILMLQHDDNLARSEGTPGEDEMLGTMVQTARGKLDDMLGGRSSGPETAGSGGGGPRGR